MHFSLEEKRCSFNVNYFFHYFALQLFQSVHHENKFREVLYKNPVTKISSTEFAVFGQLNPYIRSAKISALKVIKICSLNELLYSYIQSFLSVIKNNKSEFYVFRSWSKNILFAPRCKTSLVEVKRSSLSFRIKKHGQLF